MMSRRAFALVVALLALAPRPALAAARTAVMPPAARAAQAESLATVAQGARDWAGAEAQFRRALAGYREARDARKVAVLLGSIGVVLFNSGQLDAADSVYREALVARRALGDPVLIGRTLNALGSTQVRLGHYDAALPWLREARAVRLSLGDPAALGATLNAIAAIAPSLGMPDSARGWFDEALSLTTQAGDSARTAEVLTNRARFESEQGDATRAAALLRRALAITATRGDPAAECVQRLNLAKLESAAGRYVDSAHEARTASALALAAGDPRLVQGAAQEEARAWVLAEDPARARARLESAMALADSLAEPRLVAGAAQLAAQVARLEGDASGAARELARARLAATAAGDSALVRDVCVLAGQTAQAAGRMSEAEAWYRRAERISVSAGGAAHTLDLLNLGQVLSAGGHTDDAWPLLERARTGARTAGDPDLAWMIELAFGDAAERSGRAEQALAHYVQAAGLADTVRARQGGESSVQVFAGRTLAHQAVVHLLARAEQRAPGQGSASEAFHWAERAKARSLLDQLAAGGHAERALKPATLAEAQAALPDANTALLAYSVGDSGSALWVVRRDRWQWFALPPRAALRARVETLRRAWSTPGAAAASERVQRAARELASDLWAPALPALAGVQRLVIAPDGPLWLLPFEALPARPDETKPGVPLGERYATSYVPSAALLGWHAATHDARVVAVGDNTYGELPGESRDSLAALPHTQREVDVLRALSEPARFTALTGRAASARDVSEALASRVRVLHLATHGDPREAEPGHSGVWLSADSSGVTTRLEADDVVARGIAADLVTLSACGSGLGRVAQGEGVLGLTRAFLAAGSGSVLVSLWPVADGSTAQLMQEFYSGLLQRGWPRDRALAQAKRRLRAQAATAAPFHWAPFVLVGDPQPLSR